MSEQRRTTGSLPEIAPNFDSETMPPQPYRPPQRETGEQVPQAPTAPTPGEPRRTTASLPAIAPDFDSDAMSPPSYRPPKRETGEQPPPGEPRRTGSGAGCWVTGIITLAIFALLVVVGLLLPPVNLGQRLFGPTYVTLTTDANAIREGGLTLAVYGEDVGTGYGVSITSVDQQAFSSGTATDTQAASASAALPANAMLVGSFYNIASTGTAPDAVALSVDITDPTIPKDLLDLYGWYPDRQRWQFIPAVASENMLVAAVSEVPPRVAILAANPIPQVVIASINVNEVLSPEVAGVASVVAPAGLQPTLDGKLTGSLAAGFDLEANYAVAPAIRNYIDAHATDPATVEAILANSTLRQTHIDQIVGLATSGYDGVLIDYRDLSPNSRNAFSTFITELGARLQSAQKSLIVVVPAAQNTESGWQTGAYDWRAIGAAADAVEINLPPDPAAFVPGADRLVEAMLRWAVDEVSRQKIVLGLSALSQRQVGDGFTPMTIDQALSALGDVRLDVELAPGGTIPPGTAITARLDGYNAEIGSDESSGQPYIDYLDDNSGAITRVWLATGDAVRYRVDSVQGFAIAGVAFDDLNAQGVSESVLETLLSYKLGLPTESQSMDVVLHWTIEGRDGTIGELTTSLGETFSATIEAPDGNYAVNVEVVGVGDVVSPREGAAVAVFVPSPTPTPVPTSTPTPTPEPTARPVAVAAAPSGGGQSSAAPGAGSIVAGQFEFGGHVTSTGTGAIGAMQRAGMNWMKIQLRYGPGADPGVAAGPISEAHGRGFKILLGIVGSPGDLAGGGAAYVAGFASFVGGVAGLGPDAIEVWNEANIDREWPNGQISGAAYADMLRQSYQAIKGANGGVMVISAAPAPTGAEAAYPGAVVNDDNWLRQMVDAGGLNYLDCVGAHYNEGIVPATAASGDPRDNYYTRYFTGMVNTYWGIVGGAKPICFTELGYLTPEGYPPLDPYFAWGANTTVAQQAAWLAEAAALASQSGRVRLMIVWNVDFTFYGADPMAGFAIVRPGGGCPACDALAGAR